ncbi:MAG: DUF4838 domain-containing protein [Gemmatimonadota bacterium]
MKAARSRSTWLPLMLCAQLVPAAAGADFRLEAAALGQAAIVLAPGAGDVPRFAAAELQQHLELALGRRLPIVEARRGEGPTFYVGVRAPGDEAPLAAEEARYRVTDRAVYLYGDDQVRVDRGSPFANCIGAAAFQYNRTGSLFAVYEFLEREVGVRWLEPGDQGIACEPRATLRLRRTHRAWRPYFPYQHNFRSYAWRGTDGPAVFLPPSFEQTPEQAAARRAELDLWLRRMRMGGSQYLPFGHAFSTWWEKYGQEHPEWFALNGNGGRGPLNPDQPDRVKMCVSNPEVVRQAVADWLAARETFPLGNQALCVGLNDGGGGGAAEFCHCDACLALDVRLAGEALDAHLSDRYMHLANQALVAARREVPGAEVTAYAYAQVEQPPRREQLLDGVVLEFVTRMNVPFEQTRAIYAGWQRRGAGKLLFRPNDLCVELGLPLGQEKRLFEHQQLAVEFGAVGTDHDCVYGWWTGVSGLTYYVLARATMDPSQPFEHWEGEYAATFGAAAAEVLAYHRHWRRQFDAVIWPEEVRQQEGGDGFLSWHRLQYMSQRIEQFYAAADFDTTDALLARGLARDLTAGQRQRLERLQLANRHSRLTFQAMAAVAAADEPASRQRARALLDLRVELRDRLRMNWSQLFSEQHQMGDATGITALLIEELVSARQAFDCLRLPAPPVLDGRLDEPSWAAARAPVGFADNATAGPPKAATEAYLGYDDRYLYVGLACREPFLDCVVENVAERDGAVWKDNAVEIFLDPGNSRQDFHQLIITSRGALLDGRRAGGAFDTSWDAAAPEEVAYAVAKGDGEWTLEARIAWAALGLGAPAPGDRLRFNLNRDRTVSVPGQSESTALSPTFGGYHLPGRFATLVLR